MSSIKFPHASGNSMSIAAPASNPASDLTLTLPTTIGSNGQYMKVDGSGNLGWGSDAGKILQVVSVADTAAAVTGNTTPTDTGLDASITPTSSSSKILVHVCGQTGHYRDYSGQGNGVTIVRTVSSSDTTVFEANDDRLFYFDNGQMVGTNVRMMFSAMFEDSPDTTDPCTYKVQIHVYISSNGGQAYWNHTGSNGKGFITLMEVAG